MYYVSYIEEYPIFEPAEGGYFYAGEEVVKARAFKSWRKARQMFNKQRKRFEEQFREEYGKFFRYDCGGCSKYGDGSTVSWRGKYIGDGCEVRLTRYKPEDKGYTPYC